MPEYLSPGVYIEEISTRAKPIEGVGTSTAGFAGMTERGPEPPRLITGFLDFQRWYGRPAAQSYLSHAVRGFFLNGGQRCFVTRVVPDVANSSVAFYQLGDLVISAVGRGEWGNRVLLRITESITPGNPETLYDLALLYYRQPVDLGAFLDPFDPQAALDPSFVAPDVVERFESLSHEEGRSNSLTTVLNSGSRLVRAWWVEGTTPAPLDTREFADGPPNQAPADGQVTVQDFAGDQNPIPFAGGATPPDELLGKGRGLLGLEDVDQVAILVVPDAVRNDLEPVGSQVVNQCERLKDRFGVLALKQGVPADNNARQDVPANRDTSYAALYYPWIWVFDEDQNRRRLIPPHGHVAGVMARTDIERGVHKAPANVVPRGVLDLERPIGKGHQGILNPIGVNCLRDFRAAGRGIRVWGARTMSSDGEWKYVNVRRLFIFAEESIEEGTQWVVFEPNHEPTWAKVVRSISAFLNRLWRNGALQGVTEEEAFFVKCDRTTMTQDDIDNGRLICYIGLAPVKPAEFVIFRFSQKTVEAQG